MERYVLMNLICFSFNISCFLTVHKNRILDLPKEKEMAAPSNQPTKQTEGTLARNIEAMSLTELYDALQKLEGAKVSSAKLIAAALKSLAKLHSEDFEKVMTKAVQKVKLESLGKKNRMWTSSIWLSS